MTPWRVSSISMVFIGVTPRASLPRASQWCHFQVIIWCHRAGNIFPCLCSSPHKKNSQSSNVSWSHIRYVSVETIQKDVPVLLCDPQGALLDFQTDANEAQTVRVIILTTRQKLSFYLVCLQPLFDCFWAQRASSCWNCRALLPAAKPAFIFSLSCKTLLYFSPGTILGPLREAL